jgi:hypothetical protein
MELIPQLLYTLRHFNLILDAQEAKMLSKLVQIK